MSKRRNLKKEKAERNKAYARKFRKNRNKRFNRGGKRYSDGGGRKAGAGNNAAGDNNDDNENK